MMLTLHIMSYEQRLTHLTELVHVPVELIYFNTYKYFLCFAKSAVIFQLIVRIVGISPITIVSQTLSEAIPAIDEVDTKYIPQISFQMATKFNMHDV